VQIDVTVDSSQLQAWALLSEKKLAHSAVNALNATAKRIQQAEFEHVRRTFEVRTNFLIGQRAAAAIGKADFASVKRGQPWVEIHVWQGKRFLLPFFEDGGERRPFTPGAKHAAVPLTGGAARPSWPTSVPEALRMKTLDFKRMTRAPAPGRKRRRRAQGRPVWQGLRRTYLIPGIGVFQRSEGGSRLIYAFMGDLRIRPQLKFVKTAREAAQPWFAEEMERQLADALLHEAARGRL
jgi:hypothetical protein